MTRRLARLVALAVVGVVSAAACGSGGDDAEVLGVQAARETTVADVRDGLDVRDFAPSTERAEEPAPDVELAPAQLIENGEGGQAPAPEPAPGPTAPGDATAAPAGVRLNFVVANPVVAPGERVQGTLTAENTTGDTIDITHPSACPTSSGLFRDGTRASEARACAAVTAPDALAPGESRAWPIEIRVGSAAPGAYDAYAGVSGAGGTWYAAPVTVTVA